MYAKFLFSICTTSVKKTVTAEYWNFFKPKGHYSVNNCLIKPKIERDLDIIMINLYTKFHFSICKLCKENEEKLLVDRPIDRQTDISKKQYTLPSSICSPEAPEFSRGS